MPLQRRTDASDTEAVLDPDEVIRADRGATILVTLPSEPPADPQVDAVLAEIPGRLGVSFVSPIFKALAHWSDFLVGAWQAYAPTMETETYQAALDRIVVPRQLLPDVDNRLVDRAGDADGLRQHLRAQQALLPKLLLLASAWYRSAGGPARPLAASAPARPLAAPAPARPLAVPAPTPAGAAPSSPPPSGDDELESVYRRITELHGHPRVLSVYRGLGRWPDFLLGAAPVLYDRILNPTYGQAQRTLAHEAMAAAATLDMPPSSASETEGPAEILALFRTRLIPTLVLDTAVLLALVDPTFTARPTADQGGHAR